MYVTIAGSPDRVEAQLVPDAGYELDTFKISGFPRQPTPAFFKSLYRAGVAPRACRAILRRRRCDVVYGAGGYVAGPMVLAASTMHIPAALSEADAHLGLANRMALPFAKKVFLAYPLEGRHEPRFRVVGRPIPARARAIPHGRGAGDLRAAARRPGAPRRWRARRCTLDQRDDDRGVRRDRPGGPAHLRRARLLVAEGPRPPRRLQADPVHRADRRRVLGRGSRGRARRELGLGARGRREARDPRSLSVRDRRPPGPERRVLRQRRAAR